MTLLTLPWLFGPTVPCPTVCIFLTSSVHSNPFPCVLNLWFPADYVCNLFYMDLSAVIDSSDLFLPLTCEFAFRHLTHPALRHLSPNPLSGWASATKPDVSLFNKKKNTSSVSGENQTPRFTPNVHISALMRLNCDYIGKDESTDAQTCLKCHLTIKHFSSH